MNFLRPNRNVWRIERAGRAAVLIDAAAFFEAVRAACLKAERSIIVVGWDIDSRTRLVGADGEPADGLPGSFADFLSDLVQARPDLHVHLLLWDYSLLYAGERELLPRLSLGWQTPERVTLCIDNSVPFGSSQHQKIVVVDDAVAFSGGLDLTIRRWDTTAHSAENRHRVDPSGHPYRPFHDVQMMVDGAAAQALAQLARERWCRANGGVPRVEPYGDPWPDTVRADFTDVEVGIARTQPRYDGEEAVREAETLFVDSIDLAERQIYIENQFLSSALIADRLAERLSRCPGLEVVIVAPRSHDSWVERRTMRNGRIRFWRRLSAAGGDRVRLLYPAVDQDGRATDTMIHSKIMVVDDRFLRVGSANMNNRSMGADTECDLAVEARTDREREAVLEIRNRLLGEHCGVTAADVAAFLARHGSLVRAAAERQLVATAMLSAGIAASHAARAALAAGAAGSAAVGLPAAVRLQMRAEEGRARRARAAKVAEPTALVPATPSGGWPAGALAREVAPFRPLLSLDLSQGEISAWVVTHARVLWLNRVGSSQWKPPRGVYLSFLAPARDPTTANVVSGATAARGVAQRPSRSHAVSCAALAAASRDRTHAQCAATPRHDRPSKRP